MSIMPQEKSSLRKMVKGDIPLVLQIETAAQGAPWTEEIFKSVLEHTYEGWVLEVDDEMVGYIILSMQLDECHILNLCIAPFYQHKGYGRQLMEYALSLARQQSLAFAYLEVRRSNTRAIALYTRLHFRQIGERPDYYHTVNGKEDALVYAVSLKDIQE